MADETTTTTFEARPPRYRGTRHEGAPRTFDTADDAGAGTRIANEGDWVLVDAQGRVRVVTADELEDGFRRVEGDTTAASAEQQQQSADAASSAAPAPQQPNTRPLTDEERARLQAVLDQGYIEVGVQS